MPLMDSHGHVAASRVFNEDQTESITQRFFSRVTWQNQSTPSSIKRIGLNGDNSHPSVSLNDEEANRMVTPNFTYIYAHSSTM